MAAPFVVSERRGLPRSALPGTRDEARRIAANRLAEDRASMSETISFQDADGKRISGQFDVSHGMITVTAHAGRPPAISTTLVPLNGTTGKLQADEVWR